MSKRHYNLLGMILLALVLVGCDGENAKFKDASPEIRSAWKEAVKLDKSDSYMDAAETYDKVLHMSVTPEQATEVQMALGRMYVRMTRAAAKGNQEAKRVVEMLNENKKTRPAE